MRNGFRWVAQLFRLFFFLINVLLEMSFNYEINVFTAHLLFVNCNIVSIIKHALCIL
jgi:hypothetical protein